MKRKILLHSQQISKKVLPKLKTFLFELYPWSIIELYDEPNRSAPLSYFKEPLNGPTILKSEIQNALSSMRNGKALGSDKISAETPKALNHFGLELLELLANAIYDKGVFPDELYKSTFITIPKKSGAVNCENFRKISIMSHVTKVILLVIMLRITNKMHPEISTEQYGFMKDKKQNRHFCASHAERTSNTNAANNLSLLYRQEKRI